MPYFCMYSRVNMPAKPGSVRPMLYSASWCAMVATMSVASQPGTVRMTSPPATRTTSAIPDAMAM